MATGNWGGCISWLAADNVASPSAIHPWVFLEHLLYTRVIRDLGMVADSGSSRWLILAGGCAGQERWPGPACRRIRLFAMTGGWEVSGVRVGVCVWRHSEEVGMEDAW